MSEPWVLVLSCEHAGNRVPSEYRSCFRRASAQLRSHHGYDPGAWEVARSLGRQLRCEPIALHTTRLLVEANRSLGHPRLFSRWTKDLSACERTRLVERYWRPHRERVRQAIVCGLRRGRVLHVGVHSFTPVLDGVAREVDVGLLYDPARSAERRVAREWKRSLVAALPDVRVRCNRPYLGRSDGLTTALRLEFSPGRYAGFELELSQAVVAGAGPLRTRWTRAVAETLEEFLR